MPRQKIPRNQVEEEVGRFDQALSQAREQLKGLRHKVSEEQGEDHVYLIEAQILMLDDPVMNQDTRELMKQERINAEWALTKAFERFKRLFDQIDDEYFRDRRSDIEYVEERLLRTLAGDREQSYVSLHGKAVLVAHDLSPTDVVRVDRSNIVGITIDVGGRTSHVAIMAKSLGIPTVVGNGGVSLEVQNGDRIIVDGNRGEVIARPDRAVWNEYEEKQARFQSFRKELLKNRYHKAETKDQYEVHLLANVDLAEEVGVALENGAEGIGMLRTENLFLPHQLPVSEDEQFESYRKVIESLKPRETVIRLFDLPGDSLFGTPAASRLEHNPAMGLRGIRLLLRKTELLRTQFRAVLRASVFGKAAILYPMVSCAAEVRAANQVLAEVKKELEGEKVEFDEDLRVGSMIETPSGALTANRLAKEVQFLSIGTNDLIQYTMGVDRANELVADLYNPLHASVVRLLQGVVEMGHKAGIEVGICGEMASELSLIPLMLGLEFNFLSVNATSIPGLKEMIRELTVGEAKKCLEEVLGAEDPFEMRRGLAQRYASRFPAVFP